MREPGTEVVPADQQDHDGRHRDDRQQGRAQPRRAAAVERPDVEPARPELTDQQRGDEVARQAEEHGHPDEAVDQRPRHGVLAEDQEDRHATDPIPSRA